MTCLLIDDGGLGALAAAATQTDPARLIVWHPVRDEPARIAAEAHASALMATFVIAEDVPPRHDELDDASILLAACRAALARDLEVVAWPVHSGADARRALRFAEVAATVGDLIAAVGRRVEITLPLLECEDDQVVDLADDAGLPLGAFFDCDGPGPDPCGACPRCRRWQRAFRARSIMWPWDSAPKPLDVTG